MKPCNRRRGLKKHPYASATWETIPGTSLQDRLCRRCNSALVQISALSYETRAKGVAAEMSMTGELLHCPIRGNVIARERSSDGLRYSEEKRRIDSIRFLLGKGYPASHFKVETTLLRFGNQGRNSFRTDLAILDSPISTLPREIEELKPHIKLIAEIKRDNAEATAAKKTQVYPALDFIHDVAALGIYWDDTEQRLFYRTLKGTKTVIPRNIRCATAPMGSVARRTTVDKGRPQNHEPIGAFQED